MHVNKPELLDLINRWRHSSAVKHIIVFIWIFTVNFIIYELNAVLIDYIIQLETFAAEYFQISI